MKVYKFYLRKLFKSFIFIKIISKMRIIYLTCKDIDEAKKISRDLIKNKLVACANIFPITSMYEWDNEIKDEKEVVVLLKTNSNFDVVEKEIKKLHSYDTPAIYSWTVDKINKDYSNWINKVQQK